VIDYTKRGVGRNVKIIFNGVKRVMELEPLPSIFCSKIGIECMTTGDSIKFFWGESLNHQAVNEELNKIVKSNLMADIFFI